MNARASLIETIESLPDDRIAQIADYVEFIRQREEERQRNWQTTVEAMEAARRGELETFNSIKELNAWLDADD